MAKPEFIPITEDVPLSGAIVCCFRRWNPAPAGSYSLAGHEILLARRNSVLPFTPHDDHSRNCWWQGIDGEAKGHQWSDPTVEGWIPTSVNFDGAPFHSAFVAYWDELGRGECGKTAAHDAFLVGMGRVLKIRERA